MTHHQQLPLSKCCESKIIKEVDKTLIENFNTVIDNLNKNKNQSESNRSKNQNQSDLPVLPVICRSFEYLKWHANQQDGYRTEYHSVLSEVYQDLSIYIKHGFYDLTRHANKMKDFNLDRLSAEKKPDPRDWKGFLLSVVNLAFRAVGSGNLPPDITIELMKEKFENLDYRDKYYFQGLSEEEWTALLNYHNYLQTSLHYVKADTNDLPLMESSAFLAGINKCLQGSFKSLGKEVKQLHIIYEELIKSPEKAIRTVKGGEHLLINGVVTVGGKLLELSDMLRVPSSTSSSSSEEKMIKTEDQSMRALKVFGASSLVQGKESKKRRREEDNAYGAGRNNDVDKDATEHKGIYNKVSQQMPIAMGCSELNFETGVERIAHHDLDKERPPHQQSKDMDHDDDDDNNDSVSVYSSSSYHFQVGAFTEAIKNEVAKDHSTIALPADNDCLEMLNTLPAADSSSSKCKRIVKRERAKQQLVEEVSPYGQPLIYTNNMRQENGYKCPPGEVNEWEGEKKDDYVVEQELCDGYLRMFDMFTNPVRSGITS